MSASLPHRALASIRTAGATGVSSPGTPSGAGSGGAGTGTPSTPTPHTPLRTLTSTFASPSTIRAEEDLIVIEIGARTIRVGFAGDSAPRATIPFVPESRRRTGDHRSWHPSYRDPWERRHWCADYELWRFDVSARHTDLGLVGDRIEKAIREAITKYLLIDSKPRKMVLVVPAATPIPHLSAAMDALFVRFQPPTISLLSSAAMTTVGAGLRSALVVDIGWAETVVTAVCELREVKTERSVRAGKLLVEEVHQLLAAALGKGEESEKVVSFGECEEVTKRVVWCKAAEKAQTQRGEQEQQPLETVEEEDEDSDESDEGSSQQGVTTIPLRSTTPPTTLDIPFDDLSLPVEKAFFPTEDATTPFDDEERSLPHLVYRALLNLPIDARATVMSRIIFTGGCSAILGLRGRIIDEVNNILSVHRWDGVRGKGYEAMNVNKSKTRGWETRVPVEYLSNIKQRIARAEASGEPPSVKVEEVRPATAEGEEPGSAAAAPYIEPAFREAEHDPVEALMEQRYSYSGSGGAGAGAGAGTGASAGGPGGRKEQAQHGQLRAVDSLGPWCGASLTTMLKVLPVASVERDMWLTQGAQGASRPSEVDFKSQQRQSMGAGGLMRSVGNANWTLGVWGNV